MLAALHLVLRGNGGLDFVVLKPAITWALMIGAGYGALSLVRDLLGAIVKAARTPLERPTE
jgi:hypothetical protein